MSTKNGVMLVTEKQVLDLLGVQLDGYKLVEKIGEGAFSVVYRGENSLGDVRAFKVARKEPRYAPADTGCYGSEALVYFSGAIGQGQPQCQDLLAKQFELMSAVNGIMIAAENFQDGEYCYMRMPMIGGKSLRKAMNEGAVSIDVMISLAEGMAASFGDGEKTHGDLKPENISLNGDRIVLTDPGYFGPLKTMDGKLTQMRVTTRVYYPHLIANDLLAFGLIMLEMVLGKNILSSEVSLTEIETTGVGSGLVEQIVKLERGHNYTWSAIATLGGRGQFAEQLARSPFDALILKLLGLKRFTDSALNTGDSGSTWAEVVANLRALKAQGQALVR